MAERGKAFSKYVSTPSNFNVVQASGTLYSITGSFPSGSIVRVDDTHRLNGVLDINNAAASNTIGFFGGSTTFGRGIQFTAGLVVAASSNAKVTIEYE